jgi:GT2 family glycosyltransferase
MKLHIVMVVLNCLDMTKAAVDSIKTKHPYSLHIVDQESTDGTKEWAEGKQNGKDFWYHRYSPKVALSEAWNRGIKESLSDPECEYIFIPNNDVIFHPTTIDNLIESIDETGYAMVTGENIAPRMSIDQMMAQEKHGDKDFDMRPITSWMEEGPDFSCFMIKSGFTDQYGWFDENFYPAYCEDQDIHIRIIRAGGHAKRISRAPYYHFASQTIAKNPGITGLVHEGHAKNLNYYREKWGGDHNNVLEGKLGYQTPFNDPTNDHRFWRGCDKYYSSKKDENN